jgi:hypothetical protein
MGAAFSITPTAHKAFFVYDTTPGSVVTGQVRVINVSPVAGRVALYAVDATTGQTSGAVYLGRTAPKRGVGSWIRLSTPGITLGPHQRAVVPFSVRIPSSSGSGQHLGGIVAAPLQPRTTQVTHKGRSSFRVNIREIAIVAVEVNLPGPKQQFMSITSLTPSGRPGYQTLEIGLSNGGNTLLKGHGKLTVTNANGTQLLAKRFMLDTFVPHTQIAYPVYVTGKRLPLGRYIGRVTVTYGLGHTVTRTFGFTISTKRLRETFGSTVPGGVLPGTPPSSSSTPVWALALGALLLLALGIAGSSYYHRRGGVGRRSNDHRDSPAID